MTSLSITREKWIFFLHSSSIFDTYCVIAAVQQYYFCSAYNNNTVAIQYHDMMYNYLLL